MYEANSPTVSVCIASYNHARFLPAALDSILAQTLQDFEVVVVDDGSSDESLSILRDYAERDRRIKLFTHPGHGNRGISASWNLAYQQSTGRYLTWIGSDDAMYPLKLEHQASLLNAHPQMGLVYCPAQLIDESGQTLSEIQGTDITGHPRPLIRLIHANAIPGPAPMVRRVCLERVGLFTEGLIFSDWEMWVRILAQWALGYQDLPLVMYRIHGRNTSVGASVALKRQYILDVMMALRRKAPSGPSPLSSPEVLALLDIQITNLYLHMGRMQDAAHSLSAALQADPELSHGNANMQYFLYDTESPDCLKCETQVRELFASLPKSTVEIKEFKKKFWAAYHATRCFEGYRDHRPRIVRKHFLRAITSNLEWLRNRGFLRVGAWAYTHYGSWRFAAQ